MTNDPHLPVIRSALHRLSEIAPFVLVEAQYPYIQRANGEALIHDLNSEMDDYEAIAIVLQATEMLRWVEVCAPEVAVLWDSIDYRRTLSYEEGQPPRFATSYSNDLSIAQYHALVSVLNYINKLVRCLGELP